MDRFGDGLGEPWREQVYIHWARINRRADSHDAEGRMKSICYLPLAACLCLGGAANAAPSKEGAAPPPSPVSVAIVDEGDKGFAVRHFPTRLRLYTFDRDRPQESVCVEGCASAWPPVRADKDAKPVGEWTLTPRTDGDPQWAYKGKPVYVRYHDDPDAPGGDGEDGAWHLIPNIPRGVAPAK